MTVQKELLEEFYREQIEIIPGRLSRLEIRSTLQDEIKEKQAVDELCQKLSRQVLEGKVAEYRISEGMLYFRDRLCIPQCDELRKKILVEAHETPYTAHPGGAKMYQDLKKSYWWPGMKKDIGEFVAKCLI